MIAELSKVTPGLLCFFDKGPQSRLSLRALLGWHLFLAIVCYAIGIVSFFSMQQVQQLVIQYGASTTSVQFQLDRALKGPVFVLYELTNFTQAEMNLQTISAKQLAGQDVPVNQIEQLCGKSTFFNSHFFKLTSWKGEALHPKDVANPCGRTAFSFFNDSYRLVHTKAGMSSPVFINETGIAWPQFIRSKYRQNRKSAARQWINPENEHFINWAQVAALSQFRKVWGRIVQGLQPGKYTLLINNQYPSEFIKKRFMLTTVGLFGGKDMAYSYFFLGLGGLESVAVVAISIRVCYDYCKKD